MVKGYVRNVLLKFNLPSKAELLHKTEQAAQ